MPAPASIKDFKSSEVFQNIYNGVQSESGKEAAKKINSVFQFDVKNSSGAIQSWTLNFKAGDSGDFVKADKVEKADIVISVSDDDFIELASGKLNVKGNMMLATKLDSILKQTASAPVAKSSASSNGSGNTDVRVAGFKVSEPLAQLKVAVENGNEQERVANVKKINAIFQFDLKNSAGKVQSWTLDLKTGKGQLFTGVGSSNKPDIVMSASDDDFFDLISGKTNGQKAFMSGKLKVKGNVMLATKLDGVLKQAKAKL